MYGAIITPAFTYPLFFARTFHAPYTRLTANPTLFPVFGFFGAFDFTLFRHWNRTKTSNAEGTPVSNGAGFIPLRKLLLLEGM